MEVGFFAHKFKLYFAPQHHSISLPALPGNLTPEKLVVDYLRCLTELIIDMLRVAIRKDFSMNEVQWCLTVPAIWDEDAKQLMRTFAEKAGMTKGDLCPNNDEASPYPLRIILEPEAASVYCQDVASRNLQVFKGDKILIADLGGGTIDLAVHEVLEINASSEITKVREATSSYGAPGGGSFVDLQFFHLVNRKIKCFTDFCRNVNPSLGLDMYSWWQRFKKDYPGGDYSADYYLINSGLMDAWMRYDMERGVQKGYSEYSALHLCPADFTEIFDPQVVQAIRLIEENIGNVEILMIVGGFAANPYVKRRIQDAFKGKVKEIVIPMDPGRAICRGAASLFMKRGYIHSRISRRTYGVCSRRDYQLGDPDELVEAGDDGKLKCNGTFSVFVKKGTMLDVGSMQKRTYYPAFHDQKKIQFDLYSSPKTNPRYITEADAKNEGSFEIDISRGKSKGKDREIEVTMVFGDSLINVSAAGKNFGKNKATENYPVRFDRS
ncbi:hypothetical protein KP509_26G029100 [Ceratopteris richardii]|nr:hypothetical protein KP509_26G029100 [Ceratopteris richardii]